MKTLVVYDTKHGATEEVAVRIAETIRKNGAEAELHDLRKKGAEGIRLADYSAVALGGPFYMGRWSRRALTFAARHETDLARLKFALFTLGTDEKLGAAAARAALPSSLIAKADAAHFGGRVDFERLGGFERFIVKMVGRKTESNSTLDLDSALAFGTRLVKGGAK